MLDLTFWVMPNVFVACGVVAGSGMWRLVVPDFGETAVALVY
jgi:hypothetical protein